MTYFGALNINYKLMFCFSISDRIWCLERDFISTVYQECYKMCTEFPAQFRSKPRLFENAWYFLCKGLNTNCYPKLVVVYTLYAFVNILDILMSN